MNNKNKYLFPTVFVLWCFLILIFMAAGPASGWRYGLNPDDTPAGTLITSEAADNTLEYLDANSNPKSTEEADTITEIIDSVYGIGAAINVSEGTEVDTKYIYSTPGITGEWTFVISNEGNATMDWTLTWETTYGGDTDGTGWWEKWFLATNESEVSSGTSFSYPDDAYIMYKFRVYPSSVEANSPDGSYAIVTFYISPDQVYPKAGVKEQPGISGMYYYEGARGVDDRTEALGGYYTVITDNYSLEVQAPELTLTRISTVDAPDNYTGNAHDVVPGSLITYMLYYNNIGAGSANEVVVIDKVPTNTEGYKFNVQETEDNVTVTATKEEDVGTTGWDRYYTDQDPPSSFDYDGSGANHGDWTLSGTSGETTIESTSKYVKWEKATVEAGENYMLQWSVTVK